MSKVNAILSTKYRQPSYLISCDPIRKFKHHILKRKNTNFKRKAHKETITYFLLYLGSIIGRQNGNIGIFIIHSLRNTLLSGIREDEGSCDFGVNGPLSCPSDEEGVGGVAIVHEIADDDGALVEEHDIAGQLVVRQTVERSSHY